MFQNAGVKIPWRIALLSLAIGHRVSEGQGVRCVGLFAASPSSGGWTEEYPARCWSCWKCSQNAALLPRWSGSCWAGRKGSIKGMKADEVSGLVHGAIQSWSHRSWSSISNGLALCKPSCEIRLYWCLTDLCSCNDTRTVWVLPFCRNWPLAGARFQGVTFNSSIEISPLLKQFSVCHCWCCGT